jgi:peptide chain release factor
VQDLMLKQASGQGLHLAVIDNKEAELNGTLFSSTLMLQGDNVDGFINEWHGTIQWTAQSPYRKFHIIAKTGL